MAGRAFEFAARNGWGAAALRGLDRAVARLTGSYFARVFTLSCVPGDAADSGEFEFRWLSVAEIEAARGAGVEIDDASLAEARRGFSRCWGALYADRLAGYAWYTTEDVPPSHCLGAAIELPESMAYHYKGYTLPDYRGRGLYPRLLAAGAGRLHAEGIRRVLLAVERSNRASLQSCRRAGCEELGSLRVWGRYGCWGIVPPAAAARQGIRFLAGARWEHERRLAVEDHRQLA